MWSCLSDWDLQGPSWLPKCLPIPLPLREGQDPTTVVITPGIRSSEDCSCKTLVRHRCRKVGHLSTYCFSAGHGLHIAGNPASHNGEKLLLYDVSLLSYELTVSWMTSTGKIVAEYHQHLEEILKWLQEHGVHLEKEKCKLCVNTWATSQPEDTTIIDIPAPKNVALISWYEPWPCMHTRVCLYRE